MPNSTTCRHQVLVLNRLWQAVNIVGVERAFSLLSQENANVINTRDGSFEVMDLGAWIDKSINNACSCDEDLIKTVRFMIQIPKVLLLKRYDRMPTKEVKFNRRGVFERDNYRCQYCGDEVGEKKLNLDHVIPRDQGGRTSWENIVTSCIECNSKKANRMPHQANMHLYRRPKKPRWRPFSSTCIDKGYEKHWHHFLHSSQKEKN